MSWKLEADRCAVTGQGLGAKATRSQGSASLERRVNGRVLLRRHVPVRTQEVLNSSLHLHLCTCINKQPFMPEAPAKLQLRCSATARQRLRGLPMPERQKCP